MYFFQIVHQKMTKPYTLSPTRPTVKSSTYREPVAPNQINTVLDTDQISVSVSFKQQVRPKPNSVVYHYMQICDRHIKH